MTEHEKSRKHYEQSGTYDPNMEHFEECEVNSGAWVLIAGGRMRATERED